LPGARNATRLPHCHVTVSETQMSIKLAYVLSFAGTPRLGSVSGVSILNEINVT